MLFLLKKILEKYLILQLLYLLYLKFPPQLKFLFQVVIYQCLNLVWVRVIEENPKPSPKPNEITQ